MFLYSKMQSYLGTIKGPMPTVHCLLDSLPRCYQPPLSVIGVMKKWYARLSSIEYTPIK